MSLVPKDNVTCYFADLVVWGEGLSLSWLYSSLKKWLYCLSLVDDEEIVKTVLLIEGLYETELAISIVVPFVLNSADLLTMQNG